MNPFRHAGIRSSMRHGEQIFVRQLGAETLGTFALTLTACAMEGIAAIRSDISFLHQGIASGLTVLFVIYAISDISGAHINPAVTIAFAVHGAFDWRRVPPYLLAQCLGGTLGAWGARGLTGEAAAVATAELAVSPFRGLFVEMLTTMLLVTVIVHTSKRKGTVGSQSAIAVGATITVASLWAGPLTGAAMNPARAFGPALVGGRWGTYWVYLFGPLCGALLAVLLAFALRGRPTQEERDSAEGEA